MVLPSIQDLPDAWQTEREHLEKQGIQSLISIPMLTDNNLIGFVGLDSVSKRREYTDSEINILRVWSNMLASLLNHRRQEEFIEQTRKNYETFFNTIDDFLFVLDEQGNIIHTNTTVTKRLGYTTDELLGKSVLMVHPEDPRQEAGRIVGEMLAGTADFCPVPLVTKAGNHLAVETRVVPGFWDGKPVIFGVTKDVSKIKLSEEKFSKAFQSNSVLMAISTLEGKFIDVNHKFLNAFGYTREEIIGNTAKDLNMFLDPELLGNELKRASQTPPRDVELDVRSKSGELITGLFSSDEISIGDESCLLTIMVDITERKKAQLALQESESRFSLFMDYLPAVVFLKDQDGRTLFVNKYMQDAFGAKDWLGKTMMEVFPNELGEKITTDDVNSMELGFQKIEESLYQLDGKLHHYETQKFTIDRLGLEPWLGGISLDITERKLAEAKLRESEEKHSSMISNISDVIGIMGADGRMKYKSPNIEQYFGWKPEDLIGTDGWLTVHPDDVERIQTEFYHLLQKDNSVKTVEYKYLCKDGSYKPIELTATNLVSNKIIEGVLLNYHDITERKKGEAEILKAKNEAEKANHAKSEFLSRMSHELRTPMNSILGFAQLLEMGELNPRQLKGVNHILTSGKYLLKLIDEVLDISRIEAGKLSLSLEPVQIDSLIQEMIDSIQPLLASKHLKVELINPAIDKLYVKSDRQRLKQVLLNLLTNAVKYNKENGKISISIKVIPQNVGSNNMVRISITDTGLGISE
ncbi:MAG: PAS domain S-box protein, partial [Bacteroidales bacterium]